jgi:hypothetical protein
MSQVSISWRMQGPAAAPLQPMVVPVQLDTDQDTLLDPCILICVVTCSCSGLLSGRRGAPRRVHSIPCCWTVQRVPWDHLGSRYIEDNATCYSSLHAGRSGRACRAGCPASPRCWTPLWATTAATAPSTGARISVQLCQPQVHARLPCTHALRARVCKRQALEHAPRLSSAQLHAGLYRASHLGCHLDERPGFWHISCRDRHAASHQHCIARPHTQSAKCPCCPSLQHPGG